MYLPPVSEYMREIERREALVKPSLLKEMADGGAGDGYGGVGLRVSHIHSLPALV